MKTILLFPVGILMVVSLLALWYSRRWRSSEPASGPEATVRPQFTIINRSNTAPSFLNDWHVTPQRDDRRPIFVMQQQLSGFAAADRSTARRGQQGMYRRWSADRHD